MSCPCHDPRVHGHVWPCAPLYPAYVAEGLEYWRPALGIGLKAVVLTRAEALERAARECLPRQLEPLRYEARPVTLTMAQARDRVRAITPAGRTAP